MKKQILIATIFLFSICQSFSQDIIRLKDPKKTFKTDREPQLVYVGLGGPAIGLSVNYDRRFNKKVDGLGFNGGIGFSLSSGNNLSYTTIPFGINCLLGNVKKGRYFEVGITETILMMGSPKSSNGYYSNYALANQQLYPNSTYIFTNFIIGYRSQPSDGGFNFRGGINPILFQGGTDLGAYLSFGYNF
ncbi:MAG: hypothetical protein NTZ59_06365 [Bacteroidetes bacterium]|jgi:hypothetical protein|nr:hypothetical protein [Bacteroidota bacterium]